MASSTFADRPVKKLLLFDVDDTLTLPRQVRALLWDATRLRPHEMIIRAETFWYLSISI